MLPVSRRMRPGVLPGPRNSPAAVVTRSEIGASIGGEPAQALQVLGLRLGELATAVRKGHLGAALRQGHRCFQGAVAAADHQDLPAAEIHRVVQPVIDLVQILAGHVQLAEAAAAADGHDGPQAAHRRGAAHRGLQEAAGAPHPLDVPLSDRHVARLGQELFVQRFLHVRGYLKVAGRRHPPRIGVDRLGLRKVGDRLERPLRLEQHQVEAGLAGLERRRHAGDAPADDDQVVHPGGLAAPFAREAGRRRPDRRRCTAPAPPCSRRRASRAASRSCRRASAYAASGHSASGARSGIGASVPSAPFPGRPGTASGSPR